MDVLHLFHRLDASRRAGRRIRRDQHTCSWSRPMLLASRSVIQQHREVAALMATYGMFLGGVLTLAWAIS